MLKNKKVVYFCQECGYESSKWMGQCPGCRAWNTFVEEPIASKSSVNALQITLFAFKVEYSTILLLLLYGTTLVLEKGGVGVI